MNITRENLSDLDLNIKVEIEENDYIEAVNKSLKRMQQNAVEPGFRKGKAPLALISRKYRTSVVADEVQRIINDAIFKYVDDEKLDIFAYPILNDEKNSNLDFEKQTTFDFYFDAALRPKVEIDWSKIDIKLSHIKVGKKEVDEQVEALSRRYGKFETPDTIVDGAMVYGKAEELDENGEVKEGGLSTYAMFNTADINDDDIRASILGKAATDTLVIDAAKAFSTDTLVNKFRMTQEQAKDFKSKIRFVASSCSLISPAEVNEELFEKAFPGRGIKTEKDFRKAITEQINEMNDEQCKTVFSNKVYKTLLDNFDAPLPEAFLKRWILRNDEKATAESVDSEWADRYLPSIKWELLQNELEKISPIEPTHNDVVEMVKKILTDNAEHSGEPVADPGKREKEIAAAAETIAKDRNNVSNIVDRLFIDGRRSLYILTQI